MSRRTATAAAALLTLALQEVPPAHGQEPPPPPPPQAPTYLAIPLGNNGLPQGEIAQVVREYRTTPNYGMIISGSTIFGSLYLVSAATLTAITGDVKSAVPIAGPWIVAAQLGDGSPVSKFWLTMDGVAQGAMLTLAIAGAVVRRSKPVYERMLILPSVAGGGAGVSAVGTF